MNHLNYQNKLLQEISKALAILTPPLLLISLIRIPTLGFIFVMKLQIVCVSATVLNYFLLGKIKAKYNIITLILSFFIVGMGAIFQNKGVVFGHIFFLCSILISSVFFNFRETLSIFVLTIIIQYLESYLFNIPISHLNILAGMILSFGIIRTIYNMRSALEAANDKLSKTLEQKKIFFSSLTHELRTPLVGVKNGIDLLKDTNLDQSQKELIEIIDFSNYSLMNLVNEILDFSKMEQKKLVLIKEFCNLSQIFKTSISLHQLSANKKNIVLKSSIEIENDIFALIDEVRFIQIINNLLSNSIKYTSKGSITLAAHLIKNHEEDKAILNLSITDTGIGMEKEQIEHIFEPFNQSISNQKARIEGTGLGLSITKELIELFDGKIQINSRKSFGTEVKLSFPIEIKISNDKSELLSDDYSLNAIASILKKHQIKVIIVDDNSINRKVLEMTLKKLNIDTSSVGTGEELVSILEKEKIDIVFMDLLMPGLTGEETTALIRHHSLAQVKDTYIIACSANISDNLDYNYKAKEMNDCLGKPINKQSLFKVLQRYIETSLKK